MIGKAVGFIKYLVSTLIIVFYAMYLFLVIESVRDLVWGKPGCKTGSFGVLLVSAFWGTMVVVFLILINAVILKKMKLKVFGKIANGINVLMAFVALIVPITAMAIMIESGLEFRDVWDLLKCFVVP